MDLIGLKSINQQSCAPSRSCRGRIHYLPFLASRGYLNSLARGHITLISASTSYLLSIYFCFHITFSHSDIPASLMVLGPCG